MASVQNFASGTLSGASASSLTVSLPLGVGANRKVVVEIASEDAVSVTGLTFDGTTFFANNVFDYQPLGTGSVRGRLYYYDVPNAKADGSYNVVMSLVGASTGFSLHCWQLVDAASGTAEATATATNGSGTTLASGSVTSTDGAVLIALGNSSSPSGTLSFSGAVTERTELNESNYTSASADASTVTAGGKSFTLTDTAGGVNRITTLASFAGLSGPTITVQPTAQTKVLTNANTATFSVTATGTGSLSYDWELEDGVGSGVYANLANGSGATWTGQASASCSATLTAKTLSGRRVRCNVTDSNGTTTSTAVALTLFDGPQVTTFPATNGSGVSTATLTCDYVTGVGEAIEVRIPLSDGDVAVTVTTT